MIKRKHFQILLVISLFACVSLLAVSGTFIQGGIIQDDTSIAGTPVTIGDLLTLFGLFGTCVTIAIWFSAYKKR